MQPYITKTISEFEKRFPYLHSKVRGHPDEYFNAETSSIVFFLREKLAEAYQKGYDACYDNYQPRIINQ